MQGLKASENDDPEEGPKDRKERKDGGHEPLLLVADAHQNIQVQGNEWHQEWNDLNKEKQASLKARQGVRYLPLESLDVVNPKTMKPVPHDGKTIGEVMFRGNVVMKGYLKNKKASEESFA